MAWNIENPRCCVYAIRCRTNGKVYVGSTTNLVVRWSQHKTDLRGNNHGNKHLQAAWDRYGPDAFEMEVLEDIEDEGRLHDREQYWIDTLEAVNNRKGFNLTPIAGKSFARGLTVPPEKRAHYAITSAKTYIVTDPQGVEHAITDLKKFCRENGLCMHGMRHAMAGKCRTQHRGWLCRRADTPPDEWKQKLEAGGLTKVRTFEVTSPDGEVHIVRVRGLKAFCEKHGLSRYSLEAVYFGRMKQHRGWKCRRVWTDVCQGGEHVRDVTVSPSLKQLYLFDD